MPQFANSYGDKRMDQEIDTLRAAVKSLQAQVKALQSASTSTTTTTPVTTSVVTPSYLNSRYVQSLPVDTATIQSRSNVGATSLSVTGCNTTAYDIDGNSLPAVLITSNTDNTCLRLVGGANDSPCYILPGGGVSGITIQQDMGTPTASIAILDTTFSPVMTFFVGGGFGSGFQLYSGDNSTLAGLLCGNLFAEASGVAASYTSTLTFNTVDHATTRKPLQCGADGSKSTICFLDKTTPVGVQTLAPVATDAATTMTLVNSIRTALVNFGLGN